MKHIKRRNPFAKELREQKYQLRRIKNKKREYLEKTRSSELLGEYNT